MQQINSEKRLNSCRTHKASRTAGNSQDWDGRLKRRANVDASFCWRKPGQRSRSFSSYNSLALNSSEALRPRRIAVRSCLHHSQSTEERDVLNNCSFRPVIDKNSKKIFSKKNTKKKPVLRRLMDYKFYGDLLHKERIADSAPSFTPNLTKSKKSFKLASKTNLVSQRSTKRQSKKANDSSKKKRGEEGSAIGKLKNILAKKSHGKADETIPPNILAKLIS